MGYQIGEFAMISGVNKETIRYYERRELLKEPLRTKGGYRIYSDVDVKRVAFIRRMQELGFTLNDINKLLGVVDKDEVQCRNIFEFVSEKSEEISKKIEDLKRIELMLNDLKECCPD